jgi:hypothetical protein
MRVYVTDKKVERMKRLAKDLLLSAQRNKGLVSLEKLRDFCGVAVSLTLALRWHASIPEVCIGICSWPSGPEWAGGMRIQRASARDCARVQVSERSWVPRGALRELLEEGRAMAEISREWSRMW